MNDELGVWPTIWYWVLMIGGVTFIATLGYSIVVGFKDIKQLFVALGEAEAAPATDAGAERERRDER